MLQSYAESETNVLKSEGGYTNDPIDPGGPTNWGITIIDARKYWKASATAEDVRFMPRAAAEQIYKTKYWDALNCDALPAGLDYAVFDYGVNSGIGRSGKVLRRLCSLPDSDWHVTPAVLAEIARRDPTALISAIDAERLRFLQSLKTWPHFGTGWGRRVRSVNSIALHMALAASSPSSGAASSPRPTMPATPDNETMAKGMHAPLAQKQKTKDAVGKGGAAVSVAGGGVGLWFHDHPAVAAGIVFAGAGLTIAAVSMVERRYNAKQDVATPGIAPVPPGTGALPASPPPGAAAA